MAIIETTQKRHDRLSRLTHKPVEVYRRRLRPGHMAFVWWRGKIIQALFAGDETGAWLAALEWQATHKNGDE